MPLVWIWNSSTLIETFSSFWPEILLQIGLLFCNVISLLLQILMHPCAEYTEENPKIVTNCSHHFHLGCIYEWMERSDNCPVCGKVMSGPSHYISAGLCVSLAPSFSQFFRYCYLSIVCNVISFTLMPLLWLCLPKCFQIVTEPASSCIHEL